MAAWKVLPKVSPIDIGKVLSSSPKKEKQTMTQKTKYTKCREVEKMLIIEEEEWESLFEDKWPEIDFKYFNYVWDVKIKGKFSLPLGIDFLHQFEYAFLFEDPYMEYIKEKNVFEREHLGTAFQHFENIHCLGGIFQNMPQRIQNTFNERFISVMKLMCNLIQFEEPRKKMFLFEISNFLSDRNNDPTQFDMTFYDCDELKDLRQRILYEIWLRGRCEILNTDFSRSPFRPDIQLRMGWLYPTLQSYEEEFGFGYDSDEDELGFEYDSVDSDGFDEGFEEEA